MEPILEIELEGATLTGTVDSLTTLLKKMGGSIDEYFYNSSSQGMILIESMNEQHILNALVKHMKERADSLKEMQTSHCINQLNLIATSTCSDSITLNLAKHLKKKLKKIQDDSYQEPSLTGTLPSYKYYGE